MRRALLLGPIVIAILGVLLFVRIREQRARAEGPPSGSGTVEGTTVDHAARIAQRVTRVAVSEGATVHAGDVLVELDCTEPQARLAEADARIAAAEAQANAARAQVEAAGRQQRAASAAARATTAQLAVVEANQEAASREQERVASLGEFATPMVRDQAGDAVRTLGSQRSAVQAQATASRAQASVVGAQIDAAEATSQAATQQIEALRALRTLAQLAVDECVVHARRDGIVETVYFDEGELVSPGAPLVRVVDVHEVKATFYLPNAELGARRSARDAEVRVGRVPGRASSEGVVRHVASEAEFTPRNVQTRDRSRSARLRGRGRIRRTPAGELRAGMPAEVTCPGLEPMTPLSRRRTSCAASARSRRSPASSELAVEPGRAARAHRARWRGQDDAHPRADGAHRYRRRRGARSGRGFALEPRAGRRPRRHLGYMPQQFASTVISRSTRTSRFFGGSVRPLAQGALGAARSRCSP
jgi:HlyD family secretion protein